MRINKTAAVPLHYCAEYEQARMETIG